MAYIKIIEKEEATGRLAEIYDEIEKSRGKLAEVHKLQSLRPESIVKHMELYLEIMFSKSDLSRMQRELIAVVVSATNHCFYCQTHHGAALNNYLKDENKLKNIISNYKNAGLSDLEMVLCDYAQLLTIEPSNKNITNKISVLKEKGLSENAILDAALVISYFNFVNRMVLGIGIEMESDNGEGYKY